MLHCVILFILNSPLSEVKTYIFKPLFLLQYCMIHRKSYKHRNPMHPLPTLSHTPTLHNCGTLCHNKEAAGGMLLLTKLQASFGPHRCSRERPFSGSGSSPAPAPRLVPVAPRCSRVCGRAVVLLSADDTPLPPTPAEEVPSGKNLGYFCEPVKTEF